MKLTNKTNLPLPLYAALRDDDYTRGDAQISATGLIAPARKVALEELYADRLEEDAADKAAILIGKAVHKFIADKATGALSDQKRLMMAVNGWIVSGQTDHTDDEMFTIYGGKIKDYKTTSVYEWRKGVKEERAQQLNIYAEILRANGYTVTGLVAVMVFKDYSARQAHLRPDDNPPASILEMDVPLWPREQAQAYIAERVQAHQEARLELPECSDEERWREEIWAVTKPGAARSMKNFTTEAEAVDYLDSLRSNPANENVGHFIDHRVGEPTRCMFYCTVGTMGLCSQYEAFKAEQGEAE